MTKLKFAKIILIFILLFPFYGYALEIEEEEIHQRPRVPPVDHIFLEKESIVAFFEITDIDGYKKFIPSIFSMPENPVCRVEVVDYYKMESAPTYLETMLQILVKFKRPQTGEEIPAWHFLGLSVTTEEALGGRYTGFPKVRRKVTFENYASKYIGTSYGRDGETPTLKLTLELKKGRPSQDEKKFLDFVSPIPNLTIKDGKVINRSVAGGGKIKIYEFEKVAPQVWTIKFGDGSIEYPNDPKNYLAHLGIGKFITGYWLAQKSRFKIQYKEE
jgi:hypothetical protein